RFFNSETRGWLQPGARTAGRPWGSQFQYALAAPHAGDAGADGLQDGAAVQRADEGSDLVLHPGQLDGVGLVGDIDDAPAEDFRHALHFFALLADRTDLDQHELAFDMGAFGQIDDLDHVHQPVEVLGDLLDDLVGADR